MRKAEWSEPRRRALWGVAIVVGIVAVGAIGFDIARRAGEMRAASTPAASVLASRTGAAIKAVVRIESQTGPNAYSAELLESAGGTDYRGTASHIRVALGANTSVIMGASGDVKRGAVIQTNGAIDSARTLHADQIVILSGFVRVLPDK
jgi:hypothetical protein